MSLRHRLTRFSMLAAVALLAAPSPSAASPLSLLEDLGIAPQAAQRPDVIPTPESFGPAADWAFESGVTSRRLGIAAATAGDVNGDGLSDVAALGENGASTSLYIFHGSPAGPVLAPGFPVDLPDSDMGLSVSAAGDVNNDGFGDVAVGLARIGGGNFRVYLGSATGLTLTGYFEVAVTGNPFASVVRPAGDVNGDGYADVLVGSPDVPASLSICGGSGGNGRVDLYFGSASGTTSAGSQVALGCQWVNPGGSFGRAIATGGDINADGYDDVLLGGTNSPASGSVWTLFGSPSGLPTFVSTPGLIQFNANFRMDAYNFGSGFGAACFTAGDVNGDGYADVAVGAPTEDTYGVDAGLAWIFKGGPAGPDTTQKLWFETGAPGSRFGQRIEPAGDHNGDGRPDQLVAMNGSLAVVTGYAGSAFIFQNLSYDPASVSFGTAGDVNGDGLSDALVGDFDYTNGQVQEGRLLIHYGKADPPATSHAWERSSAATDPGLGWSVTSIGDVNGDGLDDVAVGSPFEDDGFGGSSNGLVQVFYGNPAGLSTGGPNWFTFGSSGDYLGVSVAGAGDINGDGYADMVAGAHQYQTGNGKALVWYGGPGGLPGSPSVTLLGTRFGDTFGGAVASAGDVNGDGYGDVIVGAPFEEDLSVLPSPLNDEGIARVYLGGAAGLSASPAWSDRGGQADMHYGSTVASIGDANGDGASDVVVGAPDYDVPSGMFLVVDSGQLRIFNGRYSGTPLMIHLSIDGPANSRLGASAAGAGDVDGDGYSDLLAGAPSFNSGQGLAVAYPGSPAGIWPGPMWTQGGVENFSSFGSSVATAGDVNLDGKSDVLVGAVFRDNGGAQDRGYAAIYPGPLPTAVAPIWNINGPSSFANLGHSVASAGDVNGDSRNDLIFGMPGYTNSFFRQGLVRVYYGGNGSALRRATLALRPSTSRIVHPLGLTDANSVFIGQTGRSAAGRVRVRQEYRMLPTPGLNAPDLSGLGPTVLTGAPGSFGSIAGLISASNSLIGGVPYAWESRTRSRSPYFPTSPWFSPSRSGALEWDLRAAGSWVAVESAPARPATLELAPIAPNPTPGAAAVSFTLARGGDVRLEVVDLQGRRVRTLATGARAAGSHRLTWDGRNESGESAATGLYFMRLEAEERVMTRKFSVLR